MHLQTSILSIAALVAAAVRAGPLLAVRQDPPPMVILVAPDSSRQYATCTSVTLSWMHNGALIEGGITDLFNMYITNVGVVPPTQSTTEPLGSTTEGIASISNPGLFPTEGPLRRRADLTYNIFRNRPVALPNRTYNWTIVVPPGWYILFGEPTDTNSITLFGQSDPFQVVEGNTACFASSSSSSSSGSGSNTGSTTSSGSGPIETSPPAAPVEPSDSNNTGVIAGAVVGSIIGIIAVVGLFFLVVAHRRRKARQTRAPVGAWGAVPSQDSRYGSGRGGIPVGAPHRLSRNADATVETEHDSLEEKDGDERDHTPSFSPEPPVFRRHSQSSQAFVMDVLSSRDPRRSTAQSFPANVTPGNASPSLYQGSESQATTDTTAVSRASAASPAPVGRSNSVARKPNRKPVPVYHPSDAGHSSTKRDSEEEVPESDLGAQMLSNSQRSESLLLNAFPFELDGQRGKVHYLIPDPPVSPNAR